MLSPGRLSLLPPLAALAFAAAHLAFEHFTGGVKSHHLLARADMPAISNWFGLVTLPLLGLALALRIRSQPAAPGWLGIQPGVMLALCGAFLYGLVIAITFSLGASSFTSALYLALFFFALVFPVYRAEYLLGFVMGSSVTFGAIIPCVGAAVFAALSFVVRHTTGTTAGVVRRWRAMPDRD